MKEDEREMDEAKGRLKPKKIEGVGWVVEIRGYTDYRGGSLFLKNALVRNLQNMDQFATAKDEKKIGKYIVGVPDPVKGKVSHAFLYKWWQVDVGLGQHLRQHQRVLPRHDPRRGDAIQHAGCHARCPGCRRATGSPRFVRRGGRRRHPGPSGRRWGRPGAA